MRLFRADKKLSTLFFSRFLRYNIRMKNRTSTWIFFCLFVLNASGVCAAMVENPRQGLVAISVTSHPAFSLETPKQHQGLTRVLLELVSVGAFTSKDPIGFNGGMNLYRYADNNPVLFIDTWGLWTMNVGDSLLASKIKQAVADRLTGALTSTNGKTYLLEAAWKSGLDIANDFNYGTPPNIEFVDGIWPKLGYDYGAGGTKIAAELLNTDFLKTTDLDSLAYAIADTIIHEMSHWKNRVNGTPTNPMQGWEIMTKAFGYQKIPKVFPEGSECPTSTSFIDATLLISE